jgi:hypothetical protein
MKYLKLFNESYNDLVNEDSWEDLKDLIQMDILDRFNISNELVSESIPGRRNVELLEPELHIRINERMDNNEPKEIMSACRDLYKRVYSLMGLFIDVRWSSQQVNIMLMKFPNHWTVIREFGLEEVDDDNIYNYMSGGLCDYDKALRIIDYLNGFYKFVYNSEVDLFKRCLGVLDGVRLVFSLPKFGLDRYSQRLCFKFLMDGVKYCPIFVVDTTHVDSPFIRMRISNSSWNYVSGSEKMLNYLASNFGDLGGFNESVESSSSDYYEEINFNEFDKEKKLRIPMVLVKKISMRLNPDYLPNRNISPIYLFLNPVNSFSDLSFTIRMSVDEWFWVDVDNSLGIRKDYLEDHVYYKCDQEEGLMRLLGDFGLFK